MSKISFNDQNNDHKYFSILQNILSYIGLTAFERSVYWAIKESAGEKGCCTKSYKKLAEISGMSECSLKRILESLSKKNSILKKPLIKIKNRVTESGDRDTNEITLTDLWSDNINHFQKKIGQVTQTPPQVTQTPGVRSHRPEGQVTQTYKQEPLNKNLYEQQQGVAVYFDCLKEDNRLSDEDRSAIMKLKCSEGRVKLAIDHSKIATINTTLIQYLIWHCKCPKPPKPSTESFLERFKKQFHHREEYRKATCLWDENNVAFFRGTTHKQVSLNSKFFKKEALEMLATFGIDFDEK